VLPEPEAALRHLAFVKPLVIDDGLCYNTGKNRKGRNTMDSSAYNRYLAAIKEANDDADRDALRAIQKDMIKNYGLSDDDVDYLIRQFRYHID